MSAFIAPIALSIGAIILRRMSTRGTVERLDQLKIMQKEYKGVGDGGARKSLDARRYKILTSYKNLRLNTGKFTIFLFLSIYLYLIAGIALSVLGFVLVFQHRDDSMLSGIMVGYLALLVILSVSFFGWENTTQLI